MRRDPSSNRTLVTTPLCRLVIKSEYGTIFGDGNVVSLRNRLQSPKATKIAVVRVTCFIFLRKNAPNSDTTDWMEPLFSLVDNNRSLDRNLNQNRLCKSLFSLFPKWACLFPQFSMVINLILLLHKNPC